MLSSDAIFALTVRPDGKLECRLTNASSTMVSNDVLPPDAWASLRLALVPAVEVLRVSWPVHRIWEAGESGAPSTGWQPAETWLRVWRQVYKVYQAIYNFATVDLSSIYFDILKALEIPDLDFGQHQTLVVKFIYPPPRETQPYISPAASAFSKTAK